MPTAEKRAILDEISETLQNSGALYVTKYQGMSVDQANKLRGAFRKGNVHTKFIRINL